MAKKRNASIRKLKKEWGDYGSAWRKAQIRAVKAQAKARRKGNVKNSPLLKVTSARGRKVNPKTRVSMSLGTLKRMLGAARAGRAANTKVRTR